MKLRSYIKSLVLALSLMLPILSFAANKGWEPTKSVHTEAKSVTKDARIEVLTRPSTIIVNVSQPVKIEVFTILGRLVSSTNLNPGTYEFPVSVHGVYIVKFGETTCKIAV